MTQYHYADATDAAAWTKRGTTIERSIQDGQGALVAIRSGSQTKLQLMNLHGDVIAEIANQANPPRPQRARPGYGNSAIQLAIARPAGTQSGDILLAEIAARDYASITPPSGWTLLSGSNATSDSLSIAVYAHLAATSEPSNDTFSFDAYGHHAGGINAVRNDVIYELTKDPYYSSQVGTPLKKMTDLEAAVWLVLRIYENPADQSQAQWHRRYDCAYAIEFNWDDFVKTGKCGK